MRNRWLGWVLLGAVGACNGGANGATDARMSGPDGSTRGLDDGSTDVTGDGTSMSTDVTVTDAAGDGGTSVLGGPFYYGINLGYRHAGWAANVTGHLASQSGATSVRASLPESFLDMWGTTIEQADMMSWMTDGMSHHVCFLSGPSLAHSNAPDANSTSQYSPRNLYQPIFMSDGTVNPNNYWAAYVARVVGAYHPFIDTWEVWNEPDFVANWRVVAGWATSPPTPSDLTNWHDTIFAYVRMLRITFEVAHHVDPNARVAVGGLGYPTFMQAILRYTDNPTDGSVSTDYPSRGGAYFDVTSLHYYPVFGGGSSDTGVDGFVQEAQQFNDALSAVGISNRAMVFTETGAPHQAVGTNPGGDEYARNYLLKVMTVAQAQGMFGVHWFDLSDSTMGNAAPGPFDYMGLYQDVLNLAAPTDAQRTNTGDAYLTLSSLLHGAVSDTGATTALALPTAARGAAFRLPNGKHALVLWARSPTSGESASTQVAVNTTSTFASYAWDYSRSHTMQTVAPSSGHLALSLTGSPQIFIEQ